MGNSNHWKVPFSIKISVCFAVGFWWKSWDASGLEFLAGVYNITHKYRLTLIFIAPITKGIMRYLCPPLKKAFKFVQYNFRANVIRYTYCAPQSKQSWAPEKWRIFFETPHQDCTKMRFFLFVLHSPHNHYVESSEQIQF